MLTNLSNEILEAAKLLKDEQDLIGSSEAIANILCDWLCQELEEIEWNYQHSSFLQRKIFNLEMNTEKLAA
jgi:hypothetical protein